MIKVVRDVVFYIGMIFISLLILIVSTSTIAVASDGSNVSVVTEEDIFTIPGTYCKFTSDSESTKLAKELGTPNAICDYISTHISYNEEKYDELKGKTGYVPDPDLILAEGNGICFDYSSLAAAMFRSIGVPTKIVIGNVIQPNGTEYHSWNEIFIDGDWQIIDLTFKAACPTYVPNPDNYEVIRVL